MKHLINKLTGGDMWVHESRANEYLAAGHTLAADSKPVKKVEAPIMPEPEAKEVKEDPKEKKAEKPVKKTTVKRGKR